VGYAVFTIKCTDAMGPKAPVNGLRTQRRGNRNSCARDAACPSHQEQGKEFSLPPLLGSGRVCGVKYDGDFSSPVLVMIDAGLPPGAMLEIRSGPR